MITNWKIGDRVKITKETWLNIRNGNRSILHYPCDSYVNTAYGLMKNEVAGTVSMKFPPGYEVNVTFDDGTILQVKDHWIDWINVEDSDRFESPTVDAGGNDW